MSVYTRSRTNQLFMQGILATFVLVSTGIVIGFVGGRIAGDPMPDIGVFLFMTAWVIGVNAMAVREFFFEPTVIRTTAWGILFESRWRPSEIPWADLVEIRSPVNDPGRQAAIWRWRGGKRRTWTAYDGWHRLLGEIEARAPQAAIKGFSIVAPRPIDSRSLAQPTDAQVAHGAGTELRASSSSDAASAVVSIP